MPRPERWIVVGVLCAGALAARFIVGAHVTDDAYITMRYSRNLSGAGVMSFNPPDAVLGTSSPLWTLVLAGGALAGAAPESTAIAIASLADLASIAMVVASPAGASLAALTAGATIAAWPAYVAYGVSGMETSLYVATIVGFMSAASRKRVVAAAVAASLACLTRPDGVLLPVLGILWALRLQGNRGALKFIGVVLVSCLPWLAYAFGRFGSAVPASLIAKASAGDPWFASFHSLYAYFCSGIYGGITVFALIGFITLVRSGQAFWRMWSLWAWTYAAGMTAANAFTHFPWYFVPLLPVYTAAAALGVEGLVSRVKAVERLAQAPAVRVSFAALAIAALLSRMPALRTYLDTNSSGRETLYASIAVELASIDPHCTVAATEIGAIGYYYPGRVLDLVGLVSPEVLGRSTDAVLAETDARWLVSYDTHLDRRVASSRGFVERFERRSVVAAGTTRNLEVYERRYPGACR